MAGSQAVAAHVQTVDRISVSKQHEILIRAHRASDVLLGLQSFGYAFRMKPVVADDQANVLTRHPLRGAQIGVSDAPGKCDPDE